MLFYFLPFFTIVCAVYFLLPSRFQNSLLLLASLLFYACIAPYYLPLFISLTLFNFVFAQWIESHVDLYRRLLFFAAIATNLAILCAFRYFDFLNIHASEIARILDWNYSASSVSLLLPIGLSFLVFQSISYVVEVYRGKYSAEKSFVPYALYSLFFARILSGPIERPSSFLPQLASARGLDRQRVVFGLERILWGFFKKIVIADNIALLTTHVWSNLPGASGFTLFLLAFLYPFQMYADFSGYVDIALGSAGVLGIRLTENFNHPFSSRSITEYWQRWHMSLSNWLRDYLYYPLAFSGARKTQLRRYISLFVTFVLIGLWHGAHWTFFAFGIINGTYRVLNSALSAPLARVWQITDSARLPTAALQMIATYCLTVVSLLFFGAPSVPEAWYVLTHMFTMTMADSSSIGIPLVTLMAVLVAIVSMEIVQWRAARGETTIDYIPLARWSSYGAIFAMIIIFGNLHPLPFIYFQF